MKKVLILIPVIFWFVWLTWLGLAPHNTLKRLQDRAFELAPRDSIDDTPLLRDQIRELAFKSNLTSLKKDSIHLIVDLRDSLVGLYINGVMIHKVKTEAFFLDPILTNISNIAYLNLFESAIPILDDTSTIIKEPIVVRHAPKDTIEAALNAYKPDTLYQNPAFWLVHLPGEVELVFSQMIDKNPEDQVVRRSFFEYVEGRVSGKSFSQFLRLKGAQNQVKIEIQLPVEDLRAIYRALPENAKLVLYY